MVRKYILLIAFPNTNACLLKTDFSYPNSSFRNKMTELFVKSKGLENM